MSQGRSVVSLAQPQESAAEPVRPAALHRADTRFLTHLLAVRAQLPSQRAKRRAAPDEGAAAYRQSTVLDQPVVQPLRLDTKA
jgi:hypothetical protein